MKDFDCTYSEETIHTYPCEYGVIKGNDKLLLIKTGLGGEIYGYEKKYLKIANAVYERFGYTVIVCSNPSGSEMSLHNLMYFVDFINPDFKEIYYMGHSNGALIGAWEAYKYPKIKRLLLINGPLNYNFHKTKEGLEKFAGEKATLVYGTEDPSFPFFETIDFIKNDIVKKVELDGIDHEFIDKLGVFINLPFIYLLNDNE